MVITQWIEVLKRMTGWSFIIIGVVLAGIGGILSFYGQQLLSQSAPTSTSASAAQQITINGNVVQVLPPAAPQPDVQLNRPVGHL